LHLSERFYNICYLAQHLAHSDFCYQTRFTSPVSTTEYIVYCLLINLLLLHIMVNKDYHIANHRTGSVLADTVDGLLVDSSVSVSVSSSARVRDIRFDRPPLTLVRASGIDSVRRCFAPLGGSYISSTHCTNVTVQNNNQFSHFYLQQNKVYIHCIYPTVWLQYFNKCDLKKQIVLGQK